MKNLFNPSICVVLLLTASLWSQQGSSVNDDGASPVVGEDRMLTPPQVSGQSYPIALGAEEHANSLHYGLNFTSAYSDNVLGGITSHPISDMSYSLWPTIGVDEATTRLNWDFTYSPGFTFYQHTSERNEADHNASLRLDYRLSPHVTVSAQDVFRKSSNVFNQPSYSSGQVYGGAQAPNDSVVAPLADQISNYGTIGIAYQYARNDMIGAGGSFSNLHYPDPTQVPGLYDSSSQTGSAFYTHRVSTRHYLGVAYQNARLVSYPETAISTTQTQSFFPFYTFYPNRRLSLSFYGGPQHSDVVQPAVQGYPAFSLQRWSPAGGASVDWEGHFVGGALSYSHVISEGGGLIGPVTHDSATASMRLQLSPSVIAFVSGFYDNNKVIGYSTGMNGHSYSGSVGVGRQLGQHLGVQLGYSRLHQIYSAAAIATAPNTNRGFISFSYMFARPLGR